MIIFILLAIAIVLPHFTKLPISKILVNNIACLLLVLIVNLFFPPAIILFNSLLIISTFILFHIYILCYPSSIKKRYRKYS